MGRRVAPVATAESCCNRAPARSPRAFGLKTTAIKGGRIAGCGYFGDVPGITMRYSGDHTLSTLREVMPGYLKSNRYLYAT